MPHEQPATSARDGADDVPEHLLESRFAAVNLRVILHSLDALWPIAVNYTPPDWPESPNAEHEKREAMAYDLIHGCPPESAEVGGSRVGSIHSNYTALVALDEDGRTGPLETLAAWELVRDIVPILLKGRTPNGLRLLRRGPPDRHTIQAEMLPLSAPDSDRAG
jgi:hypothetical protein